MAWTRLYLDEMARIQERLQGLFERALLPSGYPGQEGSLGSWSPPVDLADTGGAYRLEAELPGTAREDIQLSIHDRKVELSGRVPPPGEEADDEEPGSGMSFLRLERRYGPFRRIFELDAPVDSEGVTAQLEQGVLTVMIPKRADGGAESRKIAVNDVPDDAPEGDEP